MDKKGRAKKVARQTIKNPIIMWFIQHSSMVYQWFRQKKSHWLFPLFASLLVELLLLLISPTVGTIGLVLVYLALVIFPPWDKIQDTKVKNALRYSTPAIICLIIGLSLWSKMFTPSHIPMVNAPNGAESSSKISDNRTPVDSSVNVFGDNTSLFGPSNPTFIGESHIKPNQSIECIVGGNVFGSNWQSLIYEKSMPLTLPNGAVVFIYPENGRVYVDASVYGGENITPIHIHGLSYVVTPANWDQNYDNNKFEVVNQDGDPVFQVIYPYQFMALVFGIFPGPNGVYWATPSVIHDSWPFSIYHLKPIFEYPSSLYKGVVRPDWRIEWEREK